VTSPRSTATGLGDVSVFQHRGGVTPAEAARRLREFTEQLADPRTAEEFAEAMLHQALALAARRPTPQAPAASRGIHAERNRIVGNAGEPISIGGRSVPLGDILMGSEFGSDEYVQFGPRQPRGAWLFPAADDPATMAEVETDRVDVLIDEAVR